MKYTTNNLKKMETLFEELAYTVRYEKGNFQAGYCIVQDKKIAIINKFYDTEGRINCLLDILNTLEVNTTVLSEKSAKFHKEILNSTVTEEADEQTVNE